MGFKGYNFRYECLSNMKFLRILSPSFKHLRRGFFKDSEIILEVISKISVSEFSKDFKTKQKILQNPEFFKDLTPFTEP